MNEKALVTSYLLQVLLLLCRLKHQKMRIAAFIQHGNTR